MEATIRHSPAAPFRRPILERLPSLAPTKSLYGGYSSDISVNYNKTVIIRIIHCIWVGRGIVRIHLYWILFTTAVGWRPAYAATRTHNISRSSNTATTKTTYNNHEQPSEGAMQGMNVYSMPTNMLEPDTLSIVDLQHTIIHQWTNSIIALFRNTHQILTGPRYGHQTTYNLV